MSKKWTNIQEASSWSTALSTTRTISCKAWNYPVEYSRRETKHDIKESWGNMSHPIFKGKVQGWKHPLRVTFAQPKLLSSLQYKWHHGWQQNCWSLRCSWSIACQPCSNYIFILNLTPGFNGLAKGSCKTKRQSLKFWDSVCLIF